MARPMGVAEPQLRFGRHRPAAGGGGLLHADCERIFRLKEAVDSSPTLRLHRHQREAVETAGGGHSYVLTTGTGSGKSLAYLIQIVDRVLRSRSVSAYRPGIKAIVVYPMNALANSQYRELHKLLEVGFPDGAPVTFARYTGQESDADRKRIIENPPDILLTNYVMLDLVLTRPRERALIEAAQGLWFLVLDESHTYRGRWKRPVSDSSRASTRGSRRSPTLTTRSSCRSHSVGSAVRSTCRCGVAASPGRRSSRRAATTTAMMLRARKYASPYRPW